MSSAIRTARTHIAYRDFICPAQHAFKCAVATRFIDADHCEIYYQPLGIYAELPIPKCPAPGCTLIGEESAQAARSMAQVPAEERFQAWLSPDGSKVAVPMYRGREMPMRYKNAGYITVEAANIRDLDRLDRIRSAQTGNDAYNEMNYSPAQRREHEEADYSESETSIT